MAEVLLDTTVVSFFVPQRLPRPERVAYQHALTGEIPFICFQTEAELWRWAERNNWSEPRRRRLDAFIRRFGILPYEQRLARVWAKVITEAERAGRRLESGDAWIIASAVAYQLPLYTHDRDFVGVPIDGLDVVSFLD